MFPLLELLGQFLAIGGSLISIYGTLRNNLLHDHRGAMIIWALSNPLLLLWATGYGLQYWDGGLSAAGLWGMYFVFSVSNIYGLRKEIGAILKVSR